MAKPWEWLNKYLTGTQLPTVEEGVYLPTKGLFGKGGEYGTGGLFTTPPEDPGGGMLNLFSNLPAVTGMEIIQKGFEGKPIEQTLMPAFKSGLTTTTAVERVKAARKKKKFIKEYADKVPEKYKKYYDIFPELTVRAILQQDLKTPTLAMEGWGLFNEARNLSKKEHEVWYKNLSTANRHVYDTKVKPKMDEWEAIVKLKELQLEDQSKDQEKKKTTSKKVINDEVINNYRIQYTSETGKTIEDVEIIKDLVENHGYIQ
jgi:hypothetical protein